MVWRSSITWLPEVAAIGVLLPQCTGKSDGKWERVIILLVHPKP